MAKRPSINHQLKERMADLRCFGQSRHNAKIEAKQAGLSRTVGIHSKSTFKAYKSTSEAFGRYLQGEGVKRLENVQENHVVHFLQQERDRGLSPYSIQKSMAALNKILNFYITKKSAELPSVSYKAVFKGRSEEKIQGYDPAKWSDHRAVIQATGCRRESIAKGDYELKAGSFYERKDGRLMVRLIEKNGKYREAPILRGREREVKEIVERRSGEPIQPGKPWTKGQYMEWYKVNASKEKVFGDLAKRAPAHLHRREYAQTRYQERLQELGREDKKDYRGWDREVCKVISKDLGHGRESVVVEHYMR